MSYDPKQYPGLKSLLDMLRKEAPEEIAKDPERLKDYLDGGEAFFLIFDRIYGDDLK